MQEITLSKFGKTFSTRNTALNIFKSVNETEEEIIVDFQSTESVTPSFCHEMLTRLISKNKKIRIINANESIKAQLRKAMAAIA